jgi:hypothetical protein
MRSLITIAFGLMLLVSAAAAQGNGNTGAVMINEETTGMQITGANVAQIADVDANLMGNNILANQIVGLRIEEGDLTGQSDGKTNAIQAADLILNDTGNGNVDSQFVGIAQVENDLTIGNITQMTVLKADDMGNENVVDQSSSSSIGIFFGFIESNLLVNSDLKQTSILNACVNGNTNNAVQGVDQFIVDNTLTNSKFYQHADINANILGNENNMGLGRQGIFQIADNNILIGSWVSQRVCLDEQSTGNLNEVSQLVRPFFFENTLTMSTALQSIDMRTRTSGSENTVDQNADLISGGNNAVDGSITQIADIETNC